MEELNVLNNLFEGLHVNVGLLTYALLIGIVIDFATGIVKGYKVNGKIYSSKLRDGGFKKAGVVLVVLIAYGLSMLFNDTNHIIFNGVQAYYVYTELVSILENLDEIGIHMPAVLKKIIGHVDTEE